VDKLEWTHFALKVNGANERLVVFHFGKGLIGPGCNPRINCEIYHGLGISCRNFLTGRAM